MFNLHVGGSLDDCAYFFYKLCVKQNKSRNHTKIQTPCKVNKKNK